jgi:glycogen operon protein
MRRTQRGNNNAYCQDNEVSWVDWSLLEKHADTHRFVKLLNARRLLRGMAHEEERISLARLIRGANKTWHGTRLGQPDWGDDSRSIALTVELREERLLLHLILNAYWEPLEFELPASGAGAEGRWRRWIDTARKSPDDIAPWQEAPIHEGATFPAGPRSVVCLYRAADAQ